jgi:hypothetical protein
MGSLDMMAAPRARYQLDHVYTAGVRRVIVDLAAWTL